MAKNFREVRHACMKKLQVFSSKSEITQLKACKLYDAALALLPVPKKIIACGFRRVVPNILNIIWFKSGSYSMREFFFIQAAVGWSGLEWVSLNVALLRQFDSLDMQITVFVMKLMIYIYSVRSLMRWILFLDALIVVCMLHSTSICDLEWVSWIETWSFVIHVGLNFQKFLAICQFSGSN